MKLIKKIKITPRKLIAVLLFSLLIITSTAFAATAFTVKAIRVVGLQRIDTGTVLNYLPVSVGERLELEHTGTLITALYQTGFFDDVQLSRQGNTLIVKVVERPTIGDISFSGNKDIPKDKFEEVLKQIGLAQGRIFNPSILDKVKREIKLQYNSRGKYNAKVETIVTPLSRNRVSIKIEIIEGKVTKIKSIRIIGSEAFKEKTLLKQFTLSTKGWWLFDKKRQYSKEKLDASLENLKSYYMDRGYIRFKIESTQVSLTPDRKHVYITVKINEGAKYSFKEVGLAGELILPEAQLRELILIKPGETFSRKVVTGSVEAISNALGEEGYGFAIVNAQPDIDDASQQVTVTFLVNPGQRVYTRRINFKGNVKTADYVLRRALRQREGELLSLRKLRESERQLNLLGYIKDVKVKTVPVPGTNNQVDLEYSMAEAPSTEATAAMGYGTNGLEFNAAFNQYNFMGTGKTVGINFNKNKVVKNYSFNYYEPYITPSGVGRGVNIYYRTTNPGRVGVSNYTTDRYGGTLSYNFPLGDRNSLQASLGYSSLELTAVSTTAPIQVQRFVTDHGTIFRQAQIQGGWLYNSYDRAPFPTRGFRQGIDLTLALPAASDALEYYKVDYSARWYLPLFRGFIFTARTDLGYGNGFADTKALPFYENYYAGGIGTRGEVRGFNSYSLGPKDNQGRAIGGNLLVSGGVAVILPDPLSTSSTRTSVFLDAGNVYYHGGDARFRGVGGGPLRYSVGVGLDWRSPVGLFKFSFGKPLNLQPGDNKEVFQFTIGTSF